MPFSVRSTTSILLLVIVGAAWGQGKTTTVTTQDGKVIDVQQTDNPPPARAFNTFQEADRDGNGRIDRGEAHDAGITAFRSADLNHDGWLDEQEYEAVASGETRLPAGNN